MINLFNKLQLPYSDGTDFVELNPSEPSCLIVGEVKDIMSKTFDRVMEYIELEHDKSTYKLHYFKVEDLTIEEITKNLTAMVEVKRQMISERRVYSVRELMTFKEYKIIFLDISNVTNYTEDFVEIVNDLIKHSLAYGFYLILFSDNANIPMALTVKEISTIVSSRLSFDKSLVILNHPFACTLVHPSAFLYKHRLEGKNGLSNGSVITIVQQEQCN